MSVLIRPFRESDLPALEQCIVEMQEFERGIDPRLRRGTEMASAYTAELRERCANQDGVILVAVLDGAVTGFVAVQARVPYDGLDDPPGEHALISDLTVLPEYRRKGAGRALLEAAEAHVRRRGSRELRIGVLAGNAGAKRVYQAAGFRPYLEILHKILPPPAKRADGDYR